jgi:aspartate-semialdehyde dehydrogenase
MTDGRIPVAILGATGNVGQRFIELLEDHPWFRVAELVASERSAGKTYREAADWRLGANMPDSVADLPVLDYDTDLQSPIAFSGLPGEVAGEIEQRLAKNGLAVLSNTSTHRMDPYVPLLNPEVNAEHVDAIALQQEKRGWSGFIATNANCSTIHLVLTLKPLQQAFGLEAAVVTTLQAVSGAGYPGVPSLDMIDNVVPFIRTEEEKMAEESRKILGGFEPGKGFVDADFVPVRDGHTETASVRLTHAATPAEVIEAFESFRGMPQEMGLPGAPPRPIVVRPEENRPQPALDRDTSNGMVSVVGRVRECPVMGVKYVLLGHNTVRGAAGASILNAELFREKGLLPI